jgi:hypothetical protein
VSLGLGRFFSSLILYTVGRTPWTGDQAVARPLPSHRQPYLEWDSIPAFERAKTGHALDRAATLIVPLILHVCRFRRFAPEYTEIALMYF